MLNKVTLIGNLGKDPEVRSMQNGTKAVNFSVATSESWKDKNTGERKTATQWHAIVIFNEHIGKVAESYLKKGSKVYLEGSLQSRKWSDNDGNERTVTEVVLQRFGGALVLLDGKSDDGARQEKAPAQSPGFDDEIPF